MIIKTLWWIRQIIEVYLAVFSFSVMFVTFIVEIFFRYVMDNPLTWPYELTTVTFVWAVVLGASYAMRRRDHLMFTLLYDRLPERAQLVVRFISNGLVCSGLLIVYYPSLSYISFMGTQSTTVLNIPFSVVYGPFMYFLSISIFYLVTDIVNDVKLAIGKGAVAEKGEKAT